MSAISNPTTADCCICLCLLTDSQSSKASENTQEVAFRVFSCNHAFHKECIDKWIASKVSEEQAPNCPVCRSGYEWKKRLITHLTSIKPINWFKVPSRSEENLITLTSVGASVVLAIFYAYLIGYVLAEAEECESENSRLLPHPFAYYALYGSLNY